MKTGISEEEREAIRTQLNDLEQETLKEKNANPGKLCQIVMA